MPNVNEPTTDIEYAEWLAKLAQHAIRHASALPLSTLQIANLDALSRLFSKILDEGEQSKSVKKQSATDRERLRRDVELQCQKYCRQILDDPSVSEEVKSELGLAKPEARKSTARRRTQAQPSAAQMYA